MNMDGRRRRASTTSSRNTSKKRKDDDEDDSLNDDNDDQIQDEASSLSWVMNKKQERKTTDHHAESSTKRKEPTPRKAVIQPHKARKLNDALKDFQNNFGISSSPSASSSATAPSSKATASKSTPLSKQNGFKSSFAAPPSNITDTTPARHAAPSVAKTTATGKPISKLHQLNTETPVKSILSKNASSTPAAGPLGGDRSGAEERKDSISRVDKGKGRAIDTPDAVMHQNNEEGEEDHEDELGHADTATNTTRKHGGVTSLLELSNKKHFKMPSTPSKPSPLSGRVVRSHVEGTPSGEDVKPLKSLGAISGLSSLTSGRPDLQESHDTSETSTTRKTTREGDIKPKWAQLLETTSEPSLNNTAAQDITELLSPRKKRKGWVPAGNAEAASLIIKRLQTGNNLWIHEISRTLSNLMATSAKASSLIGTPASSVMKVKKEYPNPYGPLSAYSTAKTSESGIKKIDYSTLARDLNPHLKLEILQILSPKAASLTWSSTSPDERGGGFITAGAAEKLLITRCRILNADAEDDGDDVTESQKESSQPFGRTLAEFDSQATRESSLNDEKGNKQASEGLVIFSLAAHSRTSTGVSMVRKEQQRPARDGPASIEAEGQSDVSASTSMPNQDKAQPQLNFSKNKETKGEEERRNRRWSVFIPASIADLHTQLRVNDEIWIWEPWSVVDLVTPEECRSVLDVLDRKKMVDAGLGEGGGEAGMGVEKASEKALLVSRFAVLL